MASPLESQIRNAIFQGFNGKLLNGTLVRTVPGGGLDPYGDPIASTTQTFGFQGITENFSAYFRAQAGIPDTDVSVLIIAGSISTVPQIDDRVTIRGQTFVVRKILEIDPANASYRLQCYGAV